MGTCGSTASPETRERNDKISALLTESKEQEEKVVKLLLLGPGSTGKTTLFKSLQMVIIYSYTFIPLIFDIVFIAMIL